MRGSRRAVATEYRLGVPEDPRPRRDVGPPFERLSGGWLALDFVNTVAAWLPDPECRGGRAWGDRISGERLASYADLLRWAGVERLIDEATLAALEGAADADPGEASAVSERARSLRGALLRLFRAAIEGGRPRDEDLRTLNRELERLQGHQRVATSDGGFSLEWASDRPELEMLLWPPLRSALALLMRPELMNRLGQCGGAACGWLFLDLGRGRARRWCDIRDCGNVAKVRAYRQRNR